MPLQSKSPLVVLHVSAEGPTDPPHAPHELDAFPGAATQDCDPALQIPLPSNPGCVWQAAEEPIAHWQTVSMVLSGLPLQSLSEDEEQSRAFGSWLPEHDPQLLSDWQVCVPG